MGDTESQPEINEKHREQLECLLTAQGDMKIPDYIIESFGLFLLRQRDLVLKMDQIDTYFPSLASLIFDGDDASQRSFKCETLQQFRRLEALTIYTPSQWTATTATVPDTKQFKQWSPKDLVTWIVSIDPCIEQYEERLSEAFEKQNVNGDC